MDGQPKDCLKYPDTFLTGSRAYGMPGPESDVDLVVMLEQREIEVLQSFAEEGSVPPGSVSMQFGQLNIIVPTSL